MKNGQQRIEAERRRQIEVEGFTFKGDDENTEGELGDAASCYHSAATHQAEGKKLLPISPCAWPWAEEWWKPAPDAIRNLEKAGALYLAEAERLDRLGDTENAAWSRASAEELAATIDELLEKQ